MFDNVDQLKENLAATDPADFFDTYAIQGAPAHFSDVKISHFCNTFSRSFGLVVPRDSAIIVGSAGLGFALHRKRGRDQLALPAFRPFRAESDVDVALCSDELFRRIWYELSAHACLQNYIPWNHSRLSNYLIYGWLRPDQFPKGKTLTNCDRFYEAVGEIRKDRKNGHPKVSVGLYYSLEQLRYYQTRSIRICKESLDGI